MLVDEVTKDAKANEEEPRPKLRNGKIEGPGKEEEREIQIEMRSGVSFFSFGILDYLITRALIIEGGRR